MRQWKKVFVVSILIIFVGTACGNISKDATSEAIFENEMVETNSEKMNYGMVEMDSVISGDEKSDENILPDETMRQYILTYNYILETLNFDETQKKIDALVKKHKGYYEETYESGYDSYNGYQQRRYSTYTLRIPKKEVTDFTDELSGVGGNIIEKTSYKEDVTHQYYDIEARLGTYRIQEERLLAILETADELEYIIELEKALADVRYNIERHTTTFQQLENKIDYTTVYLELIEVKKQTVLHEEPTTFVSKMTDGFMKNLRFLGRFLEASVLFVITKSPVLVLIGILFTIIGRWVKKKIQSRRKD